MYCLFNCLPRPPFCFLKTKYTLIISSFSTNTVKLIYQLYPAEKQALCGIYFVMRSRCVDKKITHPPLVPCSTLYPLTVFITLLMETKALHNLHNNFTQKRNITQCLLTDNASS